MRTLLLVGIGTGNPDHLTLQAVAALRRADIILLLDKGAETEPLLAFRREIVARHCAERPPRLVPIVDPPRDRAAEQYERAVVDWHGERATAVEAALTANLDVDGCAAILVWGDPSLYDSTIRIVGAIEAAGRLPLAWEVIPGITSPQALAAGHKIALNRIGAPVQITTGRRLAAEGVPDGSDAFVMLDGNCVFADLADDYDIYWSAYAGAPDEIRVAGPLAAVAGSIVDQRTAARARHGWIMDSYLLRRRSG